MKVNVIGRKKVIKDEVKEWADKKFSKLDKFFDENAEAKITMWEERGMIHAEVTVFAGGMIYRAEIVNDDEMACIDKAIAAIERQIAKNKTRLSKRLKEGAAAHIAMDVSLENIAEEHEFKVVKSKRLGVKPMSVEEAILQMNLLGHAFFVYNDDVSNNVNVVYKRKDGNYGLIELE